MTTACVTGWRSRRDRRQAAFLLGLCLGTAGIAPPPLVAQDTTSGHRAHVTAQVSAGYFPLYVTEDTHTRRWGVDVGARIGPRTGVGLGLGYTYVPQATTSASSAPRLRAVRVLLLGSVRASPRSPVSLRGGVGAARVAVRTQRIDCGDFPPCGEWAPRSGTWTLPVVECGVRVEAGNAVSGLFEMDLFMPHGTTWSALGRPRALAQFRTGVSVRLRGGDD